MRRRKLARRKAVNKVIWQVLQVDLSWILDTSNNLMQANLQDFNLEVKQTL
jgi:hypothetical protein